MDELDVKTRKEFRKGTLKIRNMFMDAWFRDDNSLTELEYDAIHAAFEAELDAFADDFCIKRDILDDKVISDLWNHPDYRINYKLEREYL